MRTAELSARVAAAIGALCILALSCAAETPQLQPGAASIATPSAPTTAPIVDAGPQVLPTPLDLPGGGGTPLEYVLYNETSGFGGNEPGNELVLASFDPVGEMTVWHSWPNTLPAREGSPAYLNNQGNLVIAGTADDQVTVDNIPVGTWSTLRLLAGDGSVLWEHSDCDAARCLHHDIEPMPNGNILAFVYYRISADAASVFGLESVDGVWMDKVVELRPVFGAAAVEQCGAAWCTDVVWEWDPANHALVADAGDANAVSSPQQMDLRKSDGGDDPIHFNGIDYNAELDQVALSSFSLSEVFIVDHSGSDEILYRWGRPSNYGQPGFDVLGHQHDPRWIDNTTMSIMNNNSPFGEFLFDTPSQVLTIDLPLNDAGRYAIVDGRFGPDAPTIVVDRQREPRLNAPFMSGANVRADGSSLVALSLSKELASFDENGDTEWLVRLPGPGGQIWKAQSLPNDDPAIIALLDQTGPLSPQTHQCTATPSLEYCQPILLDTNGTAAATALPGSDRSVPSVDVAGVWLASVAGQNGIVERPLEIAQDGTELTGLLDTFDVVGVVEGNVVEFSSTLTTPFGDLPASFELVVVDQTMTGFATLEGLPIDLPPQEVTVSR